VLGQQRQSEPGSERRGQRALAGSWPPGHEHEQPATQRAAAIGRSHSVLYTLSAPSFGAARCLHARNREETVMTIHLETTIPATPEQVYGLLADGAEFGKATGMPGYGGSAEGEFFSVHDGNTVG